MIEKPTVVVLMSTYNGAAHLEEQIESIINQEDVNVRLIIRDDGSKDDTVALAKKYTDEVIEGSNLGYRYSFLELIRNAPDADYYALSDQDDIWKPQKLVSATKMIEKQESNFGESHPVLYASSRSNIGVLPAYSGVISKQYRCIVGRILDNTRYHHVTITFALRNVTVLSRSSKLEIIIKTRVFHFTNNATFFVTFVTSLVIR